MIRLLIIALATAILAGCGASALVRTPAGRCHYHVYPDGVIGPDPACTPGALNPAAVADPQHTICVPGYSTRVRPLESWSEPRKLTSMRHYGVGNQSPRGFEFDHLDAISAGGAPMDTHNLFPEPLAGPGGAHAKDRIEAKVHRAICAGQMSIQEGMRILEGDWLQPWVVRS